MANYSLFSEPRAIVQIEGHITSLDVKLDALNGNLSIYRGGGPEYLSVDLTTWDNLVEAVSALKAMQAATKP